MGLKIQRKNQLFKLTIGGEKIHDEEWITKEEVKVVLIERLFTRFIESAVEIDMDFLAHYYVNDQLEPYPDGGSSFVKWRLETGCKSEPLYNKFEEIQQKLDLTIF